MAHDPVKTKRKRADLPAAALADALEKKLGVPVSLLVTEDAAGMAVVEVRAAAVDATLPEFTDADVADLAATVTPQPVDPDPLDVLADQLKDAKTVADLKTALTGYAAAEQKRRRTVVDLPSIGAKK